MTPVKLNDKVVLDYWNSYMDSLQLPQGNDRTWHNLSPEIIANLKINESKLIKSLAEEEKIFIQFSSEKNTNIIYDYFSLQWGEKSIILIPWLEIEIPNREYFQQLCKTLPLNTLTIIVTPQSYSRLVMELANECRLNGYPIIISAPTDIDALASLSWTLKEFINFKFIKIFLESDIQAVDADAYFQDFQVRNFKQDILRNKTSDIYNLKKAIEIRKDNPSLWLRHPDFDNLSTIIKSNNFIVLSGKSASGKSTLALALGTKFENNGKTIGYIDIGNLTNKRTYYAGLSLFLDVIESKKDMIIILDDVHTQIGLALPLLRFLKTIQSVMGGTKLKVITILWPEFLSEISENVDNAYIFNVQPSILREKIISSFGETLDRNQIEIIRNQAGDDLYILRLWLENSTIDHILSEEQLIEKVWLARTQSVKIPQVILKRVIFLTYLFGQFECDVPIPFIENLAQISSSQIQELVKSKLITFKAESISPPHRSFAALLVKYLGNSKDVWTYLNDQKHLFSISDIFILYLEAIEPSQIWSVLKLIESGNHIEFKEKSPQNIELIMNIWRSIDSLLKKMDEQQVEDPTWGKAISSCYFACQALCTVGKNHSAKKTIEFIRNCYQVKNGKLEIDLKKLSTVEDYIEIRKYMADEESVVGLSSYLGVETSDIIDIDLFHSNWASALAIGAESYINELNANELTDLAIAVENRVDEKGFFYPSRVPWLSARVLMGLSLCGRNIHNSSVVKRVSDWLLKDRENGGAREGNVWQPGTGGWNSTLETTAMVISSLRLVGVSGDNPILKNSFKAMVDLKTTWIKPGEEMDGAFALEAYLNMTNSWDDIQKEALSLANWASTIALWRRATASAHNTHEQSCRAAATAAVLIKPMWGTLKSDLPELLQAFGINQIRPHQEKVNNDDLVKAVQYEYDVAFSYARENLEFVEKVANYLKNKGIKIFFDRNQESELWGENLIDELDDVFRNNARFCIMFISKEYKQKKWTDFERRSAQARSFKESGGYILPVKIDDTDIPGLFPTIGYLDIKDHSPSKLGKILISKLNNRVN